MAQVLSVGQLNRRVQQVLEKDVSLQNMWVQGEVAQLTRHSSGHIYLSLKDAEAQVSAVIWKTAVARLGYARFQPGELVEAWGSLRVYVPQGKYQLNIEDVRPAGLGAMHLAFLELKNRLLAEGLLDAARKRPLPAFPRALAVVTSPTGAVWHDIQQTLLRRCPAIRLVLVPAVVQGPDAPASVEEALRKAQALPGVEALVLARGGGSPEDLWAFNAERVVRAVAACRLPVVAAIGHETDVTLAELVADLRAATPTAAAEMASPDSGQLLQQLHSHQRHMARLLDRLLQQEHQRLDEWTTAARNQNRLRLHRASAHLQRLGLQLNNAAQRGLHAEQHRLSLLHTRLELLDAREPLRRGYVWMQTPAGVPVRRAAQVRPGQPLVAHWLDGSAQLVVGQQPPAANPLASENV